MIVWSAVTPPTTMIFYKAALKLLGRGIKATYLQGTGKDCG